MLLTEAEYQALRAAYITLESGGEVARVILPSGKRIDYHPRNKDSLLLQISNYEIANGLTHARVYAKNIRRR
jgi:hypothetical protein